LAATTRRRSARAEPDQPAYYFYCGKGGVGKTTLAAAAARRHAAAGRRVLVVSTDPAHSLGDVLGERLTGSPRRVRSSRGWLEAAELDAARAVERWLRPRMPAFERALLRGTLLDREDVARLLRLAWPGVDELVALTEIDRLATERRAPDAEVVIVDTAPTGHTWRLLEAAATIGGVAAALEAMVERDRAVASAFGGRAARDAADALVDDLAAEARRLAVRLRDPLRTRITWITLAEPVVVAETVDALRWVRERGLPIAEIIVNRTVVPARNCARCRARAALERSALAPLRQVARGVPIRFVPEKPPGRPVVRGLSLVAGGFSLVGKPLRSGTLINALAAVKILVVAGKGGVGKTTVAAALAHAAAAGRPRRRVLVLSVDPAHSLADVLGIPLGDAARRVQGIEGQLHAREVDAAAALAREREALRAAIGRAMSPRAGGVRVELGHDREVLERLLDLPPPGLDEIVALVSVIEALDPYDLIVLDTAPTGHALRLLAMPDVAASWLAEVMRLLLKYREVARVGDVGEAVLRLSRGVRRLQALLRSGRDAQAVVVTRPEELPRHETGRLLDALAQLKLKTAAILVNMEMSAAAGCARCRAVARAEADEVERLARSRARPRGCDIIVAPLEVRPPRGLAQIARWMDRWKIWDA
jgi:arsenite/tail-anchored protein-transporting ATPase